MSTNCVSCIKNERTGTDLLCDDCRAKELAALGLELGRRLKRIAEIIEDVDQRCMAADGPVTPTLQEMTQDEISEIYKLAT